MLADAVIACDAAAAAAVVVAVAAAAPPSAPPPLDGDAVGDNGMDVGLSIPLTLLRPSDSGRSEPARLLEEPISDIRLPDSRSGLMSSSSDNVLHGATTAGRRSGIRDRSSLARAGTFPLPSGSPSSMSRLTYGEFTDGRVAGDPAPKPNLLCGGGRQLLSFFVRDV